MALHFYKFKPINMWLLDAIVNSSIYAAKPDDLNDPFDCQIDIEFELKKAQSNKYNHENAIVKKCSTAQLLLIIGEEIYRHVVWYLFLRIMTFIK